ncbi:hypothetical protein [Tautonia marina]|uniref:hypothetical protein n=1 Tax=Tautonia marina TaxID=2653855 RepID=UPI0012604B96|nr:hypothetical protein [Tautonia marina]
MPKAKTRESVADTPLEPVRQSWPVAAVWHVGAEGVEPVQEEAVLPRLLEELGMYLWNEHAKAAGREGYLALVAGGNAAWADEQHLARLLPLVEAAAGRLVADAMGRMGDRLPWSGRIVSGTDREPFVAWAFTDTNLARLEKNVHSRLQKLNIDSGMAETEQHQEQAASESGRSREQLLDALIQTVPVTAPYDEQTSALETLKNESNHHINERIEKLLKAEAKQRFNNTDSYSGKLEFTRWLNGELQRFGLAITSAEVGGPTSLTAESGGKRNEGRFRLKGKIKDEEGRQQNYTTQDVGELLDRIAFEEAHRREALSEWRTRVSIRGSGASRT